MKNYRKQNEKTIDNAFRKFKVNTTFLFKQTMEEICREAMQYALDLHDEKHSLHTKIGDSYGWIVLNNGQYISSDVNTGQGFDSDEDFNNYMKTAIPSEVPNRGWVGVIVAGMEAIGYYSVDFENDVLNNTKDFVRDNFVLTAQHIAKTKI